MSLLGFDALGRLALGQIGNPKPPTPVGGAWERPVRKTGLSAAILATVGAGFVPQPPQVVITQPTPVFTKFSQPAPTIGVRTHLQPQSVMGIGLVVLAATPGPLVFPTFSQPRFSTTVKTSLQPQPSYQVGYRGPANTADRLIFSPFEQPRFYKVKQAVHAAKPIYQVGYRGPANTSGPLVFSKFERVPLSTSKIAAHLQPQPANRGYFYTFSDDAEVIQVLQELRISYSEPRDFFSDVEIATVPGETRIASLFQEDRVLVVEPRKVVETDAEFRSDGLPNRLRIK